MVFVGAPLSSVIDWWIWEEPRAERLLVPPAGWLSVPRSEGDGSPLAHRTTAGPRHGFRRGPAVILCLIGDGRSTIGA
ncbi:hypothetical protein AERO9AM_70560 [Aeromicrobium sp. 9AM]|nr:hypothetical protein AERO9AM_70560 [Aeromicrobium sp. 9AM]